MLSVGGILGFHDDHATAARWWRRTLLLIVGLFMLRVIYLWLLCPYNLAGDEAHYWEWSRRLSPSYYSKGPGVAWAIGISTRLLGHTEAAVRLPTVIAAAVTMLSLAWLAWSISPGDRVRRAQAGFVAAMLAACIPGYQVLALLMTIDGSHVACWAAAAALGWWALQPRPPTVSPDGQALAPGRAAWGPVVLGWAGLGFFVGLGFLYKYTALLMLPGVAGFLLVHRRSLRWDRAMALGLITATAMVLLALVPVGVWNAQHDWVTVRHLLGRVHMPGGDEEVKVGAGWTPMWFLSFAGAQVGLLGGMGFLALLLGLTQSGRVFRDASDERDPTRQASARLGRGWCLWCAAPVLGMYWLLAMVKEAQANWAIAGYSTLIPLAGPVVVSEMARWRGIYAEWKAMPKPRPKRGLIIRTPETPMQVAWLWSVILGVGSLLVVSLGGWVASAPGWLGLQDTQDRWNHALYRHAPFKEILGMKTHAEDIHRLHESLTQDTGQEPILLIDHYKVAGQLAFYLPDQPVVFVGRSRLGGRRSSYDFFADTDPALPELTGRPALLRGSSPKRWHAGFHFDDIQPDASAWRCFVGQNYGGPRVDAGQDPLERTADH